jgi:hypothetical protein
MKRVLHIVRTALPEGVVRPGDLVVYTPQAARTAPAPVLDGARIWDVHDHADYDDHAKTQITSADLCRLCFEFDTVVVW